MQISSRFTIAIHILTCIDYFKDNITSSFLSKSIGVNSVIIRNIIKQLKEAKLINITQGKSGIKLNKELNKITFYDVYKAVDCISKYGIFHFHEKPNIECPVGKNIHKALDKKLYGIQNDFEKKLKNYKLSDVSSIIIKKNK